MKKKGFTLIELIVVITILAILGTIAFVSFKGYTADARNSVRSTDLSNIQKAIALKYEKNGAYVEPTNSKSLTVGGDVVGKYGSAGSNVLTSIRLSGGGTDPSTGEYYYYSVSGSNFNVLGFFEGDLALNTKTVAESLTDKSYKLYGDSPVYVTNSDLTPLSTDIADTDTTVDVVFVGDDEKREIKTIDDLKNLTKGSCKGLYDFSKSKGNGWYNISVNGVNTEVYCDMKNGGWTLVGFFQHEGMPYSGTTVGDLKQINDTPGIKYSDNTINGIAGDQFKFEGIGTIGSEFLYCKKYLFNYSGPKTTFDDSVCSKEYDVNFSGYVSNYGFQYAQTYNSYPISHWKARDVWLRNDSGNGTRWYTTKENPAGFTDWYNELGHNASPDIKLWIK